MHGPWSAPTDDAFDGRTYYAARTASDGAHRYLFGWVPTKEGERDLGAQQWGGTLVVHEVVQRPDGSLGVAMPSGVAAAFEPAGDLAPAPATADHEWRTVERQDGRASVVLGPEPGPSYTVTATVRIAPGTRSVSFRLAEDAGTGDAYGFTLIPGEQRLTFDKYPNFPWFRYDARGHERPITIDPGHDYRIRLVVDDTIATIYVDDVALNARMYDKRGEGIGFEVIEGSAGLANVSIRALATAATLV
jgi:beta-fructofuranosidase